MLPYKNASLRKISTLLYFTQRRITLLKLLSGIYLAIFQQRTSLWPSRTLWQHQCKTDDCQTSHSRRRGHTHLPPPLPNYSRQELKTGLHNATTVSLLATSGCTAGSQPPCWLWCGGGHHWVPRETELGVSTCCIWAFATSKMGNCCTQLVTEAGILQNTDYSTEGTCTWQHRGQKGELLLEIHNTPSIIRCCSSQLPSATLAATITTKTAIVFKIIYAEHQSNLRSVNAG
jgi:hypothetical protein